MHFEVLVEDRSARDALENLVPKILGANHTYRIHPYRGLGRLPPGLKTEADPKKKMLLTQLPKLLQGFGSTFQGYGPKYKAAVIVVCDLDKRCRRDFRLELLELLDKLTPRPETYFCIAEEEFEAWLLGDRNAVQTAYPEAKQAVLNTYVADSVCDTWEVLADAIYPEGALMLKSHPYSEIGTIKCEWAKRISAHMVVENNTSPSFRHLCKKMRTAAL